MDYEWKYFYESLKKNVPLVKSGPVIDNGRVLTRPAGEYSKIILNGFRNYRHSSGAVRSCLEELLKQHTEICKNRPADQMLKRRHNVLVYKYMIDTIAGDNVIAKKLAVSKVTLYYDLDKVISELAVLCLGIPFLMARTGSRTVAIEILEQYPLLLRSGDVMNAAALFPDKLQSEVRESRKSTAAYLEQFRGCVDLYMDYCVSVGEWKEERRKAVLQDVYLSSQKTARQFAIDYQYSLATIYTDMKVIAEHLGALMNLFGG